MLPDYITPPLKYAGTELNRQSPKAGGLQPLGLASAQPTQIVELASVNHLVLLL